MRASEIIRSVLDLIDEIEQTDAETESAEQFYSDEERRFDLLSPEITFGPANAPNEQYAEIEAVTTAAGGGMNGPKHPHDIRIKDPSAYPNQQEV
jgi:hypothetical protein